MATIPGTLIYLLGNIGQASADTIRPRREQGTNKLLLAGNIGFFVWNLHQLSRITSHHFSHPQVTTASLVTVGIATTILAAYALHQHRIPKGTINSEIPITDKYNVKISRSSPFPVSWSQTIHIGQIISNVALACLSNPLVHGANAALEAYRLWKVPVHTELIFERKYPNLKLIHTFPVYQHPQKSLVYACEDHPEELSKIVQSFYDNLSPWQEIEDDGSSSEKFTTFPNPCKQCHRPLLGRTTYIQLQF